MGLLNLFNSKDPRVQVEKPVRVIFNARKYNEVLASIEANPYGSEDLQKEIDAVNKYLIFET